MKVKTYMIAVYAVLVKNGKREIEELPEAYIIPVAEYLATQEEATNEWDKRWSKNPEVKAVYIFPGQPQRLVPQYTQTTLKGAAFAVGRA